MISSIIIRCLRLPTLAVGFFLTVAVLLNILAAPTSAQTGVPANAQASAQQSTPQRHPQAAPQVSPQATSTTDALVKNRLRQVALGNAAAVREEMPSLLAKHKSDAGIEFLNASVMVEPAKANAAFEHIAQTFPKSQWADDAQWRVVQYHALNRDTSRARTELQDFRRNYPNSEFLLFAAEMVKSTVGLPPSFANRPATASQASPAAQTPQSAQGSGQLSVVAAKPASLAPARTETASPELESPKSLPEKNSTARPETASAVKDAAKEGAKEYPKDQRYALQIGVFASEQNAAVEVQKLIKARIRADVVEKKINNQSRFAVIVGDYSTRTTADKARVIVQKYTKSLPIVIPKPPAALAVQE